MGGLMKTMTARDLKNKTGEAMRAVSKGERVLVTLRSKPPINPLFPSPLIPLFP